MKNFNSIMQTIRSPFLCLFFMFAPMMAQSAELLIVEEPACVFCVRFNREIAPAYPKTDEGKLAPLRRIQIADPWPSDLKSVNKATLTPTFILIDDGLEVARLVGYPGDEHFWFLLGQMLDKL